MWNLRPESQPELHDVGLVFALVCAPNPKQLHFAFPIDNTTSLLRFALLLHDVGLLCTARKKSTLGLDFPLFSDG